MSQPIISIEDNKQAASSTANLLPVGISHDSNFPHDPAHWAPAQNDDGTATSYFRGRKITGYAAKIPASHRGVMLESVKVDMDTIVIDDSEQSGLDPEGKMVVCGEFDEVVIWSQNASEDTAASDPYARNIAEWVAAAQKIHSYKS